MNGIFLFNFSLEETDYHFNYPFYTWEENPDIKFTLSANTSTGEITKSIVLSFWDWTSLNIQYENDQFSMETGKYV